MEELSSLSMTEVEDIEDRLALMGDIMRDLESARTNGQIEVVLPIQLLSQYTRLEDSTLRGLLQLSKILSTETEKEQLAKSANKFNQLGSEYQDTWPSRYWEIYNAIRSGHQSPVHRARVSDVKSTLDEVVDIALCMSKMGKPLTREASPRTSPLEVLDQRCKQYAISKLSSQLEETIDPLTVKSCHCSII